MKSLLITLTFIVAAFSVKAQINSNNSQQGDTTIYTKADKYPEFDGGEKAFGIYLGKTLHYSKEARDKHIQGKVFLQFVVEKDGNITNIKVVRGLYKDLDEASVNVMKSSPKWIPGLVNGKPVRAYYTVPFSFTLTN